MKNAFCGLFSRLEMFEVRISDLGDMSIGIFQIEKHREKKKNTENIQEMWDNYKRCSICTMVITQGKERELNRINLYSNI